MMRGDFGTTSLPTRPNRDTRQSGIPSVARNLLPLFLTWKKQIPHYARNDILFSLDALSSPDDIQTPCRSRAMPRRPASVLVLIPLALALAACKPAADPAPGAPPADTVAAPAQAGAVAGTDATAVVNHERPDPAGFDRKAFAGSFAGTLPCADCPGIDMRIDIEADGSFRASETYQDRDTTVEIAGTWTIDADGRRLLLDPDSKDEADRHFEIVSKDEIRMLDTEGKPVESALNYSLRRG